MKSTGAAMKMVLAGTEVVEKLANDLHRENKSEIDILVKRNLIKESEDRAQ